MSLHWSEDVAKEYLLSLGYELLEQNYYRRGGEIDLIMRDEDVLVFVEVKQRKSERFGTAAEMINVKKLERIQDTALDFMQKRFQRDDLVMRFDAILISGGVEGNRLEHIQNISL